MQLFDDDRVVGVFRGFTEGGLEFHADLALPYRSEFQSIPMHGQFLLVQLETPDEAVLGRITSFSSEGKLSSGAGEEFNIRALREKREIPEDLRLQYLKYKINIRVLGVLRNNASRKVVFVPSQRRLPHVGSPVAFPSDELLCEIAGHNTVGAPIGHLALGEYVYAGASKQLRSEEWMQVKSPEVLIKFPIGSLVSRRSFIFARAGFGKSNLNKLLFSRLYERTPTTMKRGNKAVPVGTVLFDPDGEYFWPDDKGRPGLCDVPELIDKLVVFTARKSASAYYQSFVAGGIRLDIRRLRPSDVIAIALSPERQEQQNVRKLRGLDQDRWEQLVNLVAKNKNQTLLTDIGKLLDLDPAKQEAEALAARANMTAIIQMLHDPASRLMDMLIRALSDGKICIVDVSQMRGAQALILSGLILRRIFDRNQQEFTAAEPRTIPTIAVIEEAQSVLSDAGGASDPYIAWVKEGRKYDLGAVLITQQPGSIPTEILSQGDNWFIFHLLSAADLANVRKANAHFSEDLLSVLLNEPIPGHAILWSSVSGKPYPVSARILSFEDLYHPVDPSYCKLAVLTYATSLLEEFRSSQPERLIERPVQPGHPHVGDTTYIESVRVDDPASESEGQPDFLMQLEGQCVKALQQDTVTLSKLKSPTGMAWGSLKAFFLEQIPKSVEDRDNRAYRMVAKALDAVLGAQGSAWEAYKNQERDFKTYVRAISAEGDERG